jgi:hypothetical protein
MSENVLGLWHNDCDFVAAESAEEALSVWAEAIGENPDSYDPEDWYRLPDDKILKGSEDSDDDADFESLTCAEWVARKGGKKRLLFSNEY